MAKAGKRVKRQIRKNKKKPTVQVTKQVAKKRMNVRELMLEKMKMGMLVPQQQMTPQQERHYNEMDKLRNQVNIAEKNLSDAKLKRKAAEEERDRLKSERDEELNKTKETKEGMAQDEREYNKKKKDFERKQAEQKEREAFQEKVKELEYMISRAEDDSEVMERIKQLAELKNQYEIIKHTTAKNRAEIDKNKYMTKIQIQKDTNEQAQAELDAVNETLNSKACTNSLEVYKENCKRELQLEDDIRLKKQQLENEKQIMAEQMKYEAQREYWYGTEQQRRQRGFISDGQRAENKLQASIVRQMNAITSLKIQNNDVVYRAEQLNAFEDQLEGATRNKAKLEAEQWRAKAMVKENKDKFDENGNLILTEEEKKTFEEEAKARTNLELEKERIKSANQKIALS